MIGNLQIALAFLLSHFIITSFVNDIHFIEGETQ